jgi:hypothetical protein
VLGQKYKTFCLSRIEIVKIRENRSLTSNFLYKQFCITTDFRFDVNFTLCMLLVSVWDCLYEF